VLVIIGKTERRAARDLAVEVKFEDKTRTFFLYSKPDGYEGFVFRCRTTFRWVPDVRFEGEGYWEARIADALVGKGEDPAAAIREVAFRLRGIR